MKKILVLITLLSGMGLAQAKNIEVKTIDEKVVEVAPEQFMYALKLHVAENNKLHYGLYVNSDGSVTIKRPRYAFAGRKYEIRHVKYDSGDKLQVCRLFGFEKTIFIEDEGDFSYVSELIELDYTGEMVGFSLREDFEDESMQKHYRAISRITCK